MILLLPFPLFTTFKKKKKKTIVFVVAAVIFLPNEQSNPYASSFRLPKRHSHFSFVFWGRRNTFYFSGEEKGRKGELLLPFFFFLMFRDSKKTLAQTGKCIVVLLHGA